MRITDPRSVHRESASFVRLMARKWWFHRKTCQFFRWLFTGWYGYQMKALGTRVSKIPTVIGESDGATRFGCWTVTGRELTLDNDGAWRLGKLGAEVLAVSKAVGAAPLQENAVIARTNILTISQKIFAISYSKDIVVAIWGI